MFTVIVACDSKNGIGKNNALPWRLKGDMQHFSQVTQKTTLANEKNVVIMGRKTYESLPNKFRPLPNRHNIVITRNSSYCPDNNSVLVANSLDDALELAHTIPEYDKFFVIGGAEIYKEAFEHELLLEVIITQIKNEYDCDAFINPSIIDKMNLVATKHFHENDIEYSIETYQKGICC